MRSASPTGQRSCEYEPDRSAQKIVAAVASTKDDAFGDYRLPNRRPIYRKTAAEATYVLTSWETTNKAADLKKSAGL